MAPSGLVLESGRCKLSLLLSAQMTWWGNVNGEPLPIGGHESSYSAGCDNQIGMAKTCFPSIGEWHLQALQASALKARPGGAYGFVKSEEVFAAFGKDSWMICQLFCAIVSGKANFFTAEEAKTYQDCWVHHQQIQGFNQGDWVSFTLILNKDGNPQARARANSQRCAIWGAFLPSFQSARCGYTLWTKQSRDCTTVGDKTLKRLRRFGTF